MPQVGESGFWESYRTDEFVVIIGQEASPGITRVSGLSLGQRDTIEQPDAGTQHVYKISTQKKKFQSLTIERNVDGSPQDTRFLDWFKESFSDASGSAVRRSGLIEKRHNGETVLTLMFTDAWIKEMNISDLEAGSSNLLKQTIVLEHEGLEIVE